MATDGSKGESIGEIDTSAPFRSVKAALSMFGGSAFSPYKSPTVSKSKPNQAEIEGDMERETQLHLAQKELSKWVEVEKSCKATRIKSSRDLDKAKKTADILTGKLQAINESKESSIIPPPSDVTPQSTCSADDDDNWKHELEKAREQHAAAVSEVDSTKQELRRIKQQLSVSVDAKQAALRREEDARKSFYVNSDRSEQLRKEIAAVDESIAHMKSKDFHSKVEETSIVSEHEAVLKSHRLALQDVENDINCMMKGFDPETILGLQRKVEETEAEIEHVQMEMEKSRVSDLDDAKVSFERVFEQQTKLNCSIVNLKNQIEASKIQHLELKEKEDQTRSVSAKLELDVHEFKAVLEEVRSSEARNREEYEQQVSNLEKLVSESDNRRKLADELKKSATKVKMESDRARDAIDEVEKKVEEAGRIAEEAKVAEAEALNQIKILNEAPPPSPSSEHATTTATATGVGGGGGAMITITAEKYESLRKSVEEYGTSADKKVAKAAGQREAIVESENKAIQQLEVSSQEKEQLKLETKEILKMAEICEEAMRAVEEEARKEIAAAEEEEEGGEEEEEEEEQIGEEEDEDENLAIVPATTNRAPQLPMEKRPRGNRKWAQKAPNIKKTLMPNLGGIFHRKKNVAGSKSPSNLPARKSVS